MRWSSTTARPRRSAPAPPTARWPRARSGGRCTACRAIGARTLRAVRGQARPVGAVRRRVPRRALPLNLARELVLTGGPISAERAHALGLVHRLCAEGQAEALALTENICANSPMAVRESLASSTRPTRLRTHWPGSSAPKLPRRADRHATGAVRPPGKPVRRAVHRFAGDERLQGHAAAPRRPQHRRGAGRRLAAGHAVRRARRPGGALRCAAGRHPSWQPGARQPGQGGGGRAHRRRDRTGARGRRRTADHGAARPHHSAAGRTGPAGDRRPQGASLR